MRKKRVHKVSGKLTQKIRREYKKLPKSTRRKLTKSSKRK